MFVSVSCSKCLLCANVSTLCTLRLLSPREREGMADEAIGVKKGGDLCGISAYLSTSVNSISSSIGCL